MEPHEIAYQKHQQENEKMKIKTQKEIDLLVTPSRWGKRTPREEILVAFDENTKRASQETIKGKHLKADIPYGPTERQQFDILSKTGDYKNSPVFIFIHGGYWMALGREQFYSVGQPLVDNGATFVTVGYDLAPNASITEIVKQVSTAIECIIKMVKEHQCGDIYLAGHSAGGHLAITCVLDSPNIKEFAGHIKGFVLLSGVYDLRAIQLSSENDLLKITEEEVEEYSPLNIKWISTIKKYLSNSKFIIIIPEFDAPEFWRCSKCLYTILQGNKLSVELYEAKGKDHFDSVEELVSLDFELTQKIVQFMGLKK